MSSRLHCTLSFILLMRNLTQMVMISRMIIVEKIQNTHRLEHMNSFLAYIKKNKDKSETATVSPSFYPSWWPVSHVVRGGRLGLALLFFLLEGVGGGVGVSTYSICTPVSSPVSTSPS